MADLRNHGWNFRLFGNRLASCFQFVLAGSRYRDCLVVRVGGLDAGSISTRPQKRNEYKIIFRNSANAFASMIIRHGDNSASL